jgi:serine/threonine-protein kinase
MATSRGVLKAPETGMRFPLAVAGQDTLLFVPVRPGGGLVAAAAGRRHELLTAAFQPWLSGPDRLLFLRRVNAEQVDLLLVGISPAGTALTGDPVTVLSLPASGGSSYSLAANGTLLYKASHGGTRPDASPAWVTLRESVSPDGRLPRMSTMGELSPDGRRIAFKDGPRIVVEDLVTGARRVPVAAAGAVLAWSHDGSRLVYQVGPSDPGGAGMLWVQVDGSAPPERLTSSRVWQQPQMVTEDGHFLVYSEGGGIGTTEDRLDDNSDLWLLPLAPRGAPRPLLQTPANERLGVVSPDSRWLAYVSDESGRSEVWIRSFPNGTAASQVSREGGMEPLWAPDGRTLYYRDTSGLRIHALPVTAGPMPEFGAPVVRVGHWAPGNTLRRRYGIARDGSALLVQPGVTYGRDLGLVLHFDEVIRRKLARATDRK